MSDLAVAIGDSLRQAQYAVDEAAVMVRTGDGLAGPNDPLAMLVARAVLIQDSLMAAAKRAEVLKADELGDLILAAGASLALVGRLDEPHAHYHPPNIFGPYLSRISSSVQSLTGRLAARARVDMSLSGIRL